MSQSASSLPNANEEFNQPPTPNTVPTPQDLAWEQLYLACMLCKPIPTTTTPNHVLTQQTNNSLKRAFCEMDSMNINNPNVKRQRLIKKELTLKAISANTNNQSQLIVSAPRVIKIEKNLSNPKINLNPNIYNINQCIYTHHYPHNIDNTHHQQSYSQIYQQNNSNNVYQIPPLPPINILKQNMCINAIATHSGSKSAQVPETSSTDNKSSILILEAYDAKKRLAKQMKDNLKILDLNGSDLEKVQLKHVEWKKISKTKVSCPLCQKSVQTKTKSYHALRCIDIKTSRCGICFNRFYNNGTRNQHLRTHMQNKPTVKCEICHNKTFGRKADLNKHNRTYHT